jgi:hypothetical protein
MPVTLDNLRDVFSYHAPQPEQIAAYQAIREAAYELTTVILEHAPICADREAGIRLIRQGVATVNAAIALKGAV